MALQTRLLMSSRSACMHAGRGNIPRNCDAGPANALQILCSSAESLAPISLPHVARQPVLPLSWPAEHGPGVGMLVICSIAAMHHGFQARAPVSSRVNAHGLQLQQYCEYINRSVNDVVSLS